jgi:hypothetical protein
MTAALKNWHPAEAAMQEDSVCRICYAWDEAEALHEETGERNEGTPRGRGPVTSVRIVEIMSGRSICQQGLVATCKDLAYRPRLKTSGGDGLAREPVGAMKEG